MQLRWLLIAYHLEPALTGQMWAFVIMWCSCVFVVLVSYYTLVFLGETKFDFSSYDPRLVAYIVYYRGGRMQLLILWLVEATTSVVILNTYEKTCIAIYKLLLVNENYLVRIAAHNLFILQNATLRR